MKDKSNRNEPLAYHITFNCYGQHLHGDEDCSVDRKHNVYGNKYFPTHPGIENFEREAMKQPPFSLDEPRRKVVLKTIKEVCEYRGWDLIAAHVRSTHVHVVVDAKEKPEKVMKDFKSYSSRRLTEAGFDDKDRKRWARHGSTTYKWTPDDLYTAVDYVVRGQGDPLMEYHEKEWPPKVR